LNHHQEAFEQSPHESGHGHPPLALLSTQTSHRLVSRI